MPTKLQYLDLEEKPEETKLKKGFKKIILTLFIIVATAGVACVGAVTYYDHSLMTAPDPTAQEQSFTIFQGQTVKGIANRLENQELISNALIFRLAAKIQQKDTSIQHGEYTLSAAMTMQEILDALQSGKLSENTITILPGWRIEDIASYLEEKGYTTADEFIDLAYEGNFDYDFLQSSEPFSKPASSSLEGYLYPDTYNISQDSDTAEIIIKMLNQFQKVYEERIQLYLDSESLFDIVTLASIVEREGRTLEEKKLIAGIYLNRLDIGMTLGACPTVLYALGDWQEELTADNLVIDSPYNTRIYAGLPPGPIANPSIDSIIAVLEPTDTEYLYFLTDKDGIMRYAYTNAEHEQNKALYGISGQ